MSKLLMDMLNQNKGLTGRDSQGSALPTLANGQQADDTFRALMNSDIAQNMGGQGNNDKHTPSRNARRAFSPANLKIPGFFRSKIWPYVIAGLFFNGKIQNAEMRDNLQVHSFKTFELTPEQLGTDTLFTAAAQKVTFNPMKNTHDTTYHLVLNQKRVDASLRGNKNGSVKPVPDKMLDRATFESYQYSGMQEYNDADMMAKYYQGHKMGHVHKTHYIRSPNAFTNFFWPTTAVTFDTRHITGTTGSFIGVKNKWTDDENLTGTMTVGGNNFAYVEKMKEFTDEGKTIGLVKIDKQQFEQLLTSGKKIQLGK